MGLLTRTVPNTDSQEWEKKVPGNESDAKLGIPGHLPLAPKVHIVSNGATAKIIVGNATLRNTATNNGK